MARCPPCLHLQLLFRLLWGWRTKVILWCCDAEYPIYWSTTKWEEHKRERQKKQKSMGFNLRIKKTKRKRKKWGSHRNEKRKRLRRRASSTTEPGGVRGEEGHFLQKGVSFFFLLIGKKSKRKASSCLLDAVSNPISVWSGSAACLPGTSSQWRRAWAATPLTSNLPPPGQAWKRGGTTMHLKCSNSHKKSAYVVRIGLASKRKKGKKALW